MEEKQSFFSALSKGQAFVFGIVGAFLILCTLGFFVILGVYLGSDGAKTSGSASVVTAGGNAKKFNACLDGGEKADKVYADLQFGESLGVQGTPALFIDGYMIAGAYPYEAVKIVLDAVLAGQVPSWDEEMYGPLNKVNIPELGNVVWYGNKNAKVTLLEFSDFQCPYCQRFAETVNQVLDNYGDQVRLAFYNFPLSSIHPQAQKASEAFECAVAQSEQLGWEMHDALFALTAQNQMSIDNFKKAADEIGLK